MNYKIVVSKHAFFDLSEIKQYISLDNPTLAKAYVERILSKIEILKEFPLCGKAIKNSIMNYTACHYLLAVNHIVIYQINELAKCIYIVRVLSHYQDWKNILQKDIIDRLSPIIKNERITLSKMDENMIFDIWKNSLDEDNRKYVPDEVFESLEETNDVVDQIIKNYEEKDGPFVYAIIRNEDRANLGYVQLVKIDNGWEIGYHIAKRYTNNGYATESLKLFIQYIKVNFKLKEIYGIALAANKASVRVLEKCGFELFFKGPGMYQGKKRNIVKTVKKI